MGKDYILLRVDDETKGVIESQEFYNYEDAKHIAEKYTKDGETNYVCRIVDKYVKIGKGKYYEN